MPTQAEYLRFQIEGGTRTPKGTAIAVPTSNVKLNRYGNLAGGQGRIKRLWAKKRIPSKARSMVLPVFGKDPSEASAAVVAVAR